MVALSRWPGSAERRVRRRNLRHLEKRWSSRENLRRVNKSNNLVQQSRPYLQGHDPEGVRIAGHGGAGRVSRVRRRLWPRHFWCAVTGKSISAGPTLPCPSRGVGENGRVPETSDLGSAILVDQDICLAREANVNHV